MSPYTCTGPASATVHMAKGRISSSMLLSRGRQARGRGHARTRGVHTLRHGKEPVQPAHQGGGGGVGEAAAAGGRQRPGDPRPVDSAEVRTPHATVHE